eukprot:GEMP01085424.1.p1 GENE.GEMP01085424.1~~GEMP01085424.1.p1  ORF type:complete len:115 (+),score=1.14 GEMP01085424.1:653-997(+)
MLDLTPSSPHPLISQFVFLRYDEKMDSFLAQKGLLIIKAPRLIFVSGFFLSKRVLAPITVFFTYDLFSPIRFSPISWRKVWGYLQKVDIFWLKKGPDNKHIRKARRLCFLLCFY